MLTPDSPQIFTPTAKDMKLLDPEGGVRRPEPQGSCINIPRSLERSVWEILQKFDHAKRADFTIDTVSTALDQLFREQMKTSTTFFPELAQRTKVPAFVRTLYNPDDVENSQLEDFWLSLCNALDIARGSSANWIKAMRRVDPETFAEGVPLMDAVEAKEKEFEMEVHPMDPITKRLEKVQSEYVRREKLCVTAPDHLFTQEELINLIVDCCPELQVEKQRQELGIAMRLVGLSHYQAKFGFDMAALPVLRQVADGAPLDERVIFGWEMGEEIFEAILRRTTNMRFGEIQHESYNGWKGEGEFKVIPLLERVPSGGEHVYYGGPGQGRIKNYNNWSKAPDLESANSLAVEFFRD
jgi:hypothetical protein